MNHELLEVQHSARQREITAWLAPTAYDVHYYQNDLANARALRHPKTCQWIFEKEEMGLLFADDPDSLGKGTHEQSFLWIYAKPVCKMQNYCAPERREIFELCNMYAHYITTYVLVRLESIKKSRTLISHIQHNANSKIHAGSRKDNLIVTLS